MNTTDNGSRKSASVAPLPAGKALDAYFLEARCKILDVAAILDRIARGSGTVADDPRMAKVRAALTVLLETEGGRAERIQQVFSLDYDPEWRARNGMAADRP